MLELYLLTRIGILSNLFGVIAFVSGIASIVFYLISITKDDWSGKNCFNEWQQSMLKRFSKKLFYTFCVSIFLNTLLPSQEEMYAIYGVGGVIDYVQSNEQAKKLPDKCINALDKWVESITPEESKK